MLWCVRCIARKICSLVYESGTVGGVRENLAVAVFWQLSVKPNKLFANAAVDTHI